MRALHRVAVAMALLCICLLPMMATADSITYTSSFTASGTVNGTPFDGNVTFSLTSDTTQIIGTCFGDPSLYCTPHETVSFTIAGIGNGTFTDPFFVFDNQSNSVAGFSDTNIEDILDLSNVAFASYDLKSSIGPLNTTYFFTDDGVLLGSSLGDIVFDSFSGTPTFTATEGTGSTPEPGSLLLFATGIAGVAGVLRRKWRV